MIKYQYYAALVLLCGTLGCGTNVKFGGRVTYSDDGSPLTTGMVCFESNSLLARGELGQDGYYDLGSMNLKDGIPKGEYRVYISGAQSADDSALTQEASPSSSQTPYASNMPSGSMAGIVYTPLIDPKYSEGKTSGLTVTIDGSSKTFDFKVDRYQPKKK